MALLPPPQKSPSQKGRARMEPASVGEPSADEEQSPRGVVAIMRDTLARPLADYWMIIGSAALLIGLGLMFVLSASSVYGQLQVGDSFFFVKRQSVFMVAGLIGAVFLARASLQSLQVMSWAALLLAYGFLVLTYTPLGVDVNGNQNWVELGTPLLRFQPAEFAKLALVMWAGAIFTRKQRKLDEPAHLLIPFLPLAGLVLLLVVFQGDMGTAVIIAGILVSLLLVVGTPKRVLLALSGVGLLGVLAMTVTSANRMRRLLAFMNPGQDLDGTNMQATVGVYALATGGWTGTGIGRSRQKWGSLPEAHTDYIYAVIGEELGLFGALLVLALFFVLGFAGIRVAMHSETLFGRVTATGITTWFLFQALVNIAVVLRMLPVMGVPLPMLSYGGSALMANMLALGVLIACARDVPHAREALQRKHDARPPRVTSIVGSRG